MNLNVITKEDAVGTLDAVKRDDSPPEAVADEGTATSSGKAPQVTADDLYSRALKYIPAPLIGIYLFATNLIIGMVDDGDDPEVGLWIALVFFAAAIVAFLLVRGVKRFVQIAISVLAFVAVAAASPGPFEYIDDWEPEYASLALVVVGVILVVFKPSPLAQED